ncbi:major facilitator superfamily domain-containing protein [Chlamydoabsidia padenii]|nr:major facilitator superfamily domain-containing protein [Chlamydoabsidia padenii]
MVGLTFCAFGLPFILNASTPYASLWFDPKERSTASMAGGLANTVGIAIADIIVPSMVPNAKSIEFNFLIIACITTGFGIPTIFVPQKPKTPPSYSALTHDERRETFKKTIWTLLSNYNFLVIFICFGILCSIASVIVSMLPQIVQPYGVSYDEAGYLGVAFILAGIVGAIVTGQFIDRTKMHKLVLRIYVPIAGFMHLALLLVVKKDNYTVIMVICAILGFFIFSLLPVALELSVECSYPVSETISSASLWMCSQVISLVFLLAMNALRDDDAACFAMPTMILVYFYNSPNKRMDAENRRGIITS